MKVGSKKWNARQAYLLRLALLARGIPESEGLVGLLHALQPAKIRGTLEEPSEKRKNT